MDVFENLSASSAAHPIRCVDMQTTGEPTRIILSGFPELSGNLLRQRDEYRQKYDEYRRQTMLEPRGHEGMYGALLVRDSELVRSGEAHIAVLYLHNEGYSTMCGHAAIALGRFLVDTHDLDVFPLRNKLEFDAATSTVTVNLHTPCGINKLSVPTIADGSKSDPTKPVSFLSVPSFVGAIALNVEIPEAQRWPELNGRTSVTVDMSYGGAWYCLVNVEEIGVESGLGKLNFKRYDEISKVIKDAIIEAEATLKNIAIPSTIDWYLYGVMIVDKKNTSAVPGASASETGLCYFAGQQVDRSPTGGCVAARMALAHVKDRAPLHEKRAFNSFVSHANGGRGAFVGANVEEMGIDGGYGISERGVSVRIEGEAFYTGAITFVMEQEDPLKDGFSTRDIEQGTSASDK